MASTEIALACSYGGTSPIVLNGFLARGYGQVSAVFAVGVLWLQLRRVGWKPSSWMWIAAFVPLALFNEGWHYRGIGGDCGIGEKSIAHDMMFIIGAMLLWQIGATLWLLSQRRGKKKKERVDLKLQKRPR